MTTMVAAYDTTVPAMFVMREGMREQICGKVIVHGKRNVFFHVQRGYFHHDRTDCPFPVDQFLVQWLKKYGVETVYHFEGPKRDKAGNEIVTHGHRARATLWKATVAAIVAAPQRGERDEGFSQRFRYFLGLDRGDGAGGWVGIRPVAEMQSGGDYHYVLATPDGPRLVLVAPGFNRCAKVEIDQAPLF